MQPRDARQRVDVQNRDAEPLARLFVDEAVVWIEQQDPPERRRQDRQEERQPQRVHDRALAENVVPGEVPGRQEGDHEGRRNPQAQQERIFDGAQRLDAGERAAPGRERRLKPFEDSAVAEPAKHHEHDRRHANDGRRYEAHPANGARDATADARHVESIWRQTADRAARQRVRAGRSRHARAPGLSHARPLLRAPARFA